MKIEMFEKVGEIVIAELRSANENKEIALIEQARQEEERRKKEEAERLAEELRIKEEREKAESTLLLIIEAINLTAAKGETILSLNWYDGSNDAENKYGFSIYQYEVCLNYFQSILESAGYRVGEPYRYSSSWRYRSGKIGYAHIGWN